MTRLGPIAIAVYLVATPSAAAEITRKPQAIGPGSQRTGFYGFKWILRL